MSAPRPVGDGAVPCCVKPMGKNVFVWFLAPGGGTGVACGKLTGARGGRKNLPQMFDIGGTDTP